MHQSECAFVKPLLDRHLPATLEVERDGEGRLFVRPAGESDVGSQARGGIPGLPLSDIIQDLVRDAVLDTFDRQCGLPTTSGIASIRLARRFLELIRGISSTKTSLYPAAAPLLQSQIVDEMIAAHHGQTDNPESVIGNIIESCGWSGLTMSELSETSLHVARPLSYRRGRLGGPGSVAIIPNPFLRLVLAVIENTTASVLAAGAASPELDGDDEDDLRFLALIAASGRVAGRGRWDAASVELCENGLRCAIRISTLRFAAQYGPGEPYLLWDTSKHPIVVFTELLGRNRVLDGDRRVRVQCDDESILYHPHVMKTEKRSPFTAPLCMGRTLTTLASRERSLLRGIQTSEVEQARFLLATLEAGVRVLKYGSNHLGRARTLSAAQLASRLQGIADTREIAGLRREKWEIVPYRGSSPSASRRSTHSGASEEHPVLTL